MPLSTSLCFSIHCMTYTHTLHTLVLVLPNSWPVCASTQPDIENPLCSKEAFGQLYSSLLLKQPKCVFVFPTPNWSWAPGWDWTISILFIYNILSNIWASLSCPFSIFLFHPLTQISFSKFSSEFSLSLKALVFHLPSPQEHIIISVLLLYAVFHLSHCTVNSCIHFCVFYETWSPWEKGSISFHSSGCGTELAVHWSQTKVTHLSRYYSQILLEVGQKLC